MTTAGSTKLGAGKKKKQSIPRKLKAGSILLGKTRVNKKLVVKTDNPDDIFPPAPDTGGKDSLEKEKVLGQVEILLLKGVSTISHVSALLGISVDTAKDYVEKVRYRWEFSAGGENLRIARGEARARLDLLVSELWQVHSNAKSDTTKLAALRQIMDVHDRRLELEGLSPKTIAIMVNQPHRPEGSSSPVDSLMHKHGEMLQLADALSSYLRPPRPALSGECIDVEAVESERPV